MRYDLAALARRARNPRRKSIAFRDIVPPSTLATELYQAGYAPLLTVWTRYAARIAAEYERSLSVLTTDSADDLDRLLDEAESEVLRLLLALRPAMRDWTLRVERWYRGKWRGAVLTATGVDVETLLGPADVAQTLDQVLSWNVSLVRDVSAQARSRISAAVFDGLRNRTPAREVARSIREATGMARDRSVRIASDQLTKLTSSLASERRREAGIDTWEWRHSQKRHPRADHQARNGKRYTDATAPEDKPGQLPFCGCRELAVLEFD